ncbi:FGGY-family carbohydrate kinase [Candidatus Pantoea multigeneris]|uniref:Carbohydrate kinase n=1 Tax=Candidatus Pantoea multigeneris TaxID=2608357 RepID=A0ABX0RJG3_9GAMM|nr:FGGY-family carbohydrate kinase [Pantoea multigeneris]NIF23534.1 carbohydrate kinase [Pantoea multigeneris]
MSQILGIDAGNTMIKAILFDTSGKVIATGECAGETHQPQPGFAERPITDIWHGVEQAIQRCLQQAGTARGEIIAVGATGHGNGLYALDRQQQPLIGIQSIDNRAIELAHELSEPLRSAEIYRRSLQQPWAASTPVLLSWLKRYQLDVYRQIGTVLCAKDVIAHYLSGAFSADYSDAAGAGLIDYAVRGYDRELLALYEIEDILPALPPLHESSDVIGYVTPQAAAHTGLLAGTPVVAGMFDVVASAVGSGVVNCGQASIVAGTWSINQVVVDKPHYRRPIFMNSMIERDRFMAIEASATSAANLDWFIREFDDGRGGQGAQRCSDSVAHVARSSQLPLYHPYLWSGRKGECAKAGFYGLSGWHTRADMLFALFEGVTFAHHAHIDRLRAAGIDFHQVTLSGGAARSCIWPQMFADVLAMPVQVAECQETGALGAAICAGVGVGLWSGLAEGVAAAVQLRPGLIQPDEQHVAFHQERFVMFKQLEQAMSVLWQKAG